MGYFRLQSLRFILLRALKPCDELIFSFHVSLNKSESSWRYDQVFMPNHHSFGLHSNVIKGGEACPGHRCCRICLIKGQFARNCE